MSRRPGITLMEVLVAIFIMGIGMLALLVLFPLGVLRMALALQKESCAIASRQATANANFLGVRNDSSVVYLVTITNPGSGYIQPPAVTFGPAAGSGAAAIAQISGGQVTNVIITNPGTGYLNNATVTLNFSGGGGSGAAGTAILADSFTNPGSPPPANAWTLLPANPHGPSYPVFVDPMGYWGLQGSLNNNGQYWIASNTTGIARRTMQNVLVNGVPGSGLTLRWTCLLDGIPYIGDSTPQYDAQPPPPYNYTRDIRYCWAYMLKRPRTADASIVDMSVVVYNNRPILSSVFNEYLYQTQPSGPLTEVTFQPPNLITIDVSPPSNNLVPPAIPGNWLLDASYIPDATNTYGTVNGYFYRIVGVTQNSETSYTFEVEQPLRNMAATMAKTSTQKIIFLEGVAEVFEKGPGRLP